MPRGGSAPGQRRGGRKPGTPNKAKAAERALEAEAKEIIAHVEGGNPAAVMAALQARSRSFRGLDEMIELAKVLKNYVVDYQAAVAAVGGKPGVKGFNAALWDRFKDWSEFYFGSCEKIAAFQDPKIKATFHVPAPRLGDDAKVIDEGKIVRIGNPQAAARAYQRLMLAPRQTPLPKQEAPPKKRSA